MSFASAIAPNSAPRSRPIAAVAGFALVYFVFCRLGLVFVFEEGGSAAIWPPAGVGLAAFMTLGRSHRWMLVPALGTAVWAANLLAGRPPMLGAWIIVPNLVQGAFSAWLYRRFAGRSLRVDSLRRSTVLLFIVTPLASIVAALIGAAMLCWYAEVNFQTTLRSWVIADTLGFVATAPFVLLALSSRRTSRPKAYYVELLAFAVVDAVLVWWMFSITEAEQEIDLRRQYVLIVLHCWAALRLRARDAAALVALTTFVAIWFTTHGQGPFALTHAPPLDQLIDAELYLTMIAATSLLVSALISERARQARRLLRATAAHAEMERLEHLRLVTDAIPDYIAYITREGMLQFTNQPHGIGEPSPTTLISRPLREVVGEDNYERLEPYVQRVLAGEKVSFETSYQRINGTPCQLRISYVPHEGANGEQLGFYCHATDVTQQKAVEEQLRRYQADLDKISRLTTMGELAGGLAHELNQPLSAIHNYARGCVRRLQSASPDMKALESALESISQEATRAGEIIAGLRRHFRRRNLDRSPVVLAEMVRRVLQICQHELVVNDIRATFSDTSPVSTIRVDAVLIEQVLLNLVRNAIDAMKGVDGPRRLAIEIRSLNERIVEILVSDSGRGYAAENEERLFEQFYTTKSDGLGMGLPIARSIIEAHGGRLTAQQLEPCGATFRFTLPLDV